MRNTVKIDTASALRTVVCAIAALLSFNPVAATAQSESELREAKVRLFSVQGDADPAIIPPGTVLPLHVDTSCYGWVATFEPTSAKVELEEMLLLPGSAANWNTTDALVAVDRTSAQSRVIADGQGGLASNAWCVAEGDPEGVYRFVILHRGRLLAELPFRIEKERNIVGSSRP